MGKNEEQAVWLPGVCNKPVVFEFVEPAQSSDGGVLLLKAADDRVALINALAQAVADERQTGKIKHPLEEMIRQRVFSIALGYPDCNDADRMAHDPALKLACGQGAADGERLSSQPTLSRFENSVSRGDLVRLTNALADTVIEHQRARRRGRAKLITIDLDPVEDPTYGGQQLTFFNAFYDNWCYLPVVASIQFGEESDQFVVGTILRPGNAAGSAGAIPILERLVPKLRAAFPKAVIRIRLDGAYANNEVLTWCEVYKVEYVVNLAKNAVLLREVEPLMKRARAESKRRGETAAYFGEFDYQAQKWHRTRRIIAKAEVTVLPGRDPRDNPRFLVTNIKRGSRTVYEIYARRGDTENRYKELKYGLDFDRTSCTSARANQLRYILSTAAFALLQVIRHEVHHPEVKHAQVCTLRERLLKIGVTITESVRRIVVRAPEHFPWIVAFRQAALALAPPHL
jgi:hypothetical protein